MFWGITPTSLDFLHLECSKITAVKHQTGRAPAIANKHHLHSYPSTTYTGINTEPLPYPGWMRKDICCITLPLTERKRFKLHLP